MQLVWVALAFFAALVSPARIALTVRLGEAPGATPDDVARVSLALRRGFYADSIVVVAPAETLHFDGPFTMPDSIRRARIGNRVIVRGSVGGAGPTMEIRLQLTDILVKPLAPVDTIRVLRDDVDAVMAKTGRAYATLLAQRFKH